MKKELASLEANIAAWNAVLNQEGVWLFLATLGCWSVPNGWLRVSALVITAGLFGWRIFSQQTDRKSFPDRCVDLETRIRAEVKDGIEQKALLYDLLALKAQYLSLKSLKRSVVYYLCSLFWLLSLFYTMFAFGGGLENILRTTTERRALSDAPHSRLPRWEEGATEREDGTRALHGPDYQR